MSGYGQYGPGLPTTGIPAVDAFLERLPQEAEKFQRIPARLAVATDAMNRAPVQLRAAADSVRQRIGTATASYARLSSLIADLLVVYRERRKPDPAEVAKGLALVIGTADLYRQVDGIERDARALAAGQAPLGTGTLVRVGAGGVIGYLIGGGIGALVGASLGFLTAARR